MEDLFSLLNARLGLLFKDEINKKFRLFLFAVFQSFSPHTGQQGSDMQTDHGVYPIRMHTGKERVQPASSEDSGG